MSTPYSGGCACGALRYEVNAEPVFTNHCQCLDCQKQSGSGHSSYLVFPLAGVRQRGSASHFSAKGDSGKVKTKAFCPHCGTPVSMAFAAMPDIFTVFASSLDDPGQFKPQLVTYTRSARAWDYLEPILPKFDQMPVE